MADENPSPTPTPGAEDPQYIKGDESCQDDNYFCSVCETGFVDPVLRHTIVEAAATLNDCEVCVTAAEVAALVEAMEDMMDLLSSKYSCSGSSDQTDSGTESYQDVSSWSEDSSNADFSLSGGTTITCNTGGSCRVRCGLSVRSSGGTSCSARLVRDSGGGYAEVSGSEITQSTGTTPTEINIDIDFTVAEGDTLKIQYKNEDGSIPNTILADGSTWDLSLIPTTLP